MTEPSIKTAMQRLGDAIRYYREQRGMSRQNAAAILGINRVIYEDWELGRGVPKHRQWVQLQDRLHRDLMNYQETFQQARTEYEANVKTQHEALTNKPFADLKPKLEIVPNIPPTIAASGLTKAYIAAQKLPKDYRTAEARDARSRAARELMEHGLSNTAIISRLRARFGVGLDPNTLSQLRAELAAEQEAANRGPTRKEPPKLQPPPQYIPPKPVAQPVPPPQPVGPITETEIISYARAIFAKAWSIKDVEIDRALRRKFDRGLSIEQLAQLRAEAKQQRETTGQQQVIAQEAALVASQEHALIRAASGVEPSAGPDIEAITKLAIEAIPNLHTLTITVADDGEATVNYTLREARTIKITRKP